MPKVSVLVPVYGVEKFIERCARSLFEQTLNDMEFIFVDDCTPDRSIEILKSVIEEYRLRFAEKKYEVRIERLPTNSGLAAVRKHPHNSYLIFFLREAESIFFNYGLQYFDGAVGRAVINKDEFHIIQCLLKQTSGTSLYIFLYPIDWDYNTYFWHILSIPKIIQY